MKKNLARLLSLVLAVTLVLPMTPVNVFATESQENKLVISENATSAMPDGVVLNYRDVEDVDVSFADESDAYINALTGTLPVSYSSASNIPSSISVAKKGNYVTSIKDQGEYGTCWAHSAISIAESSYIIDQNSNATTLSPDWNEYHLTYFFYNTPDDPLGLLGGDYVENTSGYNDLMVGGNSIFTLHAYANWIGASGSTSFSPSDVLNDTYYNDTDVAYDAAAHMQNGYMLSMPDMTSSNYTADMNVIKKMIMDYGSVAMAYYAYHNYPYYQNGYQYIDVSTGTNHAVTIVGWNDNIPASSFGITPPGDGAWLVKNSWGDWWGLDGYFWISYYDLSIDGNAYVFDFTTSETYDNNYQYDGGVYPMSGYYGDYEQTTAANAFVADSNETIAAVGFYTLDVNVDYEIRVYTDLGANANPNTGTLVHTQTGNQTYSGFHTVELTEEIDVSEGERYAIVVTLYKDGYYVYHAVDRTFQNGNWLYTYSAAKAGESYYGYDVNSLSDLNSSNTSYASGINVRIKSFTNEPGAVRLAEDGKYYYYVDDEIDYSYTGWVTVKNNKYYIKAGCAYQNSWLSYGGKFYYFGDDATMVKSNWKYIDKKYYYFNDKGIMLTNWQKVDSKWYYLGSDGAMRTNWQKIDSKWYYFGSDGARKHQWQYIGKKYYYLGTDGVMRTGWQKISNVWYYFDSNGAMQTGWLTLGKQKYYLKSDGAMVTGLQTIDSKKYYFDANGVMKTGLIKYNGKSYYFGTDGVMQTGWKQISSKWYYFNPSDGVMKTGWLQVGKQWYYLDGSGVMQTGWEKVGSKWYYFDANGVMQTGWLKLGTKWYYLNSSGDMVTGWKTIDGVKYYFDANGVWIPNYK